MRTLCRWTAVASLLAAAGARADPNDFELTRLGNPTPGGPGYRPDANGNFQAFGRSFGAAMSSANLMPPETLGHAGFSLTAELSTVRFSSGLLLPTERAQPTTLLMPGLHVRKGLPFSLELGTRVAWVEKSHMAAATGELKWAISEGFTYLPDLGLRAHVTRLLGARGMSLTTAGLDVGVGKQFPLGGMVTLTPYGGLDLVGVRARSAIVDFDPERSLESTLTSPSAVFDGTAAFAPLSFWSNVHPRFYAGVRFIGGVLQLGAEVSTSQMGSATVGDDEERSIPGLLAFNTTLGLDF